MKLFEALGLDWRILVAQFVNFAVLVWVLHRFGYKPLIKFLDDRKKKIEEGIENSEAAKKKILEIEQEKKEVILNAKKEAQKIVDQSRELAEKNREEILNKAEEEVKRISALNQAKMEQEKNKIISEAKKEIAGLVVMATERLIGKKMDLQEDKQFVEKIFSDVK